MWLRHHSCKIYPLPAPNDELSYWSYKASELNVLYAQLQSSSVREVLKYLDGTKGKINVTLANLCKEIFWERDRANSNHKYLNTLRIIVDKLRTENDFTTFHLHYKPTSERSRFLIIN